MSLRLCPHSAARTCPKGSPAFKAKPKRRSKPTHKILSLARSIIFKLKFADFNFICNPIRWWSGSLADYYLNLSRRWLQLEWLQSMRLGRNPPQLFQQLNKLNNISQFKPSLVAAGVASIDETRSKSPPPC